MIKKLLTVKSTSLFPYYNQAIERALLDVVDTETLILFLWANDKTVFIGKNQNAYSECDLSLLTASGGFLARRISGGGAVYHDKGNLNFTFLCHKSNYSLSDNFEVLLEAVRSFGIEPALSGRNDCTIDGKKFSGNAFYSSAENKCFHHGTVLISTLGGEIEKYLNVSPIKLSTKGVRSVVSRVTCLSEHSKEVSAEAFSAALEKSAASYWGAKAKEQGMELLVISSSIDEVNAPNIEKWQEFFSDEARIMGEDIQFNFRIEKRLDFGMADIRAGIEEGVIKNIKIYSDTLLEDIQALESTLLNKSIFDNDNEHTFGILSLLRERAS